MRGTYLFRQPRGLLLLCVLLSLSCRVRSTRPSAETLPTPEVPNLAPPPAPVDSEEEEFWPSIALRPITPPDVTPEPSAPEAAPSAPVEADPDQLMTSAVPELPPLVWVPGFAGADADVSGSELDAGAMRLAQAIQRQGRQALRPALLGLAERLWPGGESAWAGTLSLQSSLGRAAHVRLGQPRALRRALSAVWGVAPALTLSPGADDALMLHRPLSGPAVLLMRIPGALPSAAVGDANPERHRVEYAAVTLWGATNSGQAMGVSPVWQVSGQHGVVVAFSAKPDPNVNLGAQAAYAALAEASVRSAAELGLALLIERSPETQWSVAVLRQNEAWVASSEPWLQVGMTEILRDNQRLAETSAPQGDGPSRGNANSSGARARPARETPRAVRAAQPAPEASAMTGPSAPAGDALKPSPTPSTTTPAPVATVRRAESDAVEREPVSPRPARSAPPSGVPPTQSSDPTLVSPGLRVKPEKQ